MPVAVYGSYGFALLLIPTAAADYLEYERFQLMESLRPFIEGGKIKVFSIDSINKESWMNYGMEGRHKIIRHQQWNNYVYNEVIPFIKQHTSWDTPVIACGASFGALHSANLFFKRPDLLNGCISMSGVYDLTEYSHASTQGPIFQDHTRFPCGKEYLQTCARNRGLHNHRSPRKYVYDYFGEFVPGSHDPPGWAYSASGY